MLTIRRFDLWAPLILAALFGVGLLVFWLTDAQPLSRMAFAASMAVLILHTMFVAAYDGRRRRC